MNNINYMLIKKEIGRRFRIFRETLSKTQSQLADELDIYQSTITNIEIGKTFPGIKYLHYFHENYNLNNNWLLNGTGEVFQPLENKKPHIKSKLDCHIAEDDPRYQHYSLLIEMMQIPVIEQVVLAKLMELKVIARVETSEPDANIKVV
ncbi:MAG: helix-turn-helix domain-containing protein [Candidatus Omnitrophota bacterium]